MFLKLKKSGIIVNTEHVRWMYFDKQANVTKIYMGNCDCIEVDDDVTDVIMEVSEIFSDIKQDVRLDNLKRRLSL